MATVKEVKNAEVKTEAPVKAEETKAPVKAEAKVEEAKPVVKEKTKEEKLQAVANLAQTLLDTIDKSKSDDLAVGKVEQVKADLAAALKAL